MEPKNNHIATLLSLAMIPLSGFAIDIYLPSMPEMGRTLMAGSARMQLTISVFLISYGLSQLFVGGVLDSIGRYRLVLWSILAFVVASLVIAELVSPFTACSV